MAAPFFRTVVNQFGTLRLVVTTPIITFWDWKT
jgi:hypothetical protein